MININYILQGGFIFADAPENSAIKLHTKIQAHCLTVCKHFI